MKYNQDAEHLRLLSVFHYVVAGMTALFSMIPFFHVAMGSAIVVGAFDNPDNGDPPPPFFGWFFIIFPGIFIVGGLALATCVAIAGRCLAKHTRYMYCLVMAAIECMFMPLGTVLGVFTIIVLVRPSTKELFGLPPLVDS